MVKIIDYRPEHAVLFKTLNEAWITKYFEMEESDRKMLDDPQGYILDQGGAILIATLDDKVVGSCALIKMEEGKYELAKMAVDPSAQGKSIGYLLGISTLEKAKALNAGSVYLETNSKLLPAISLYKKLGFEEVKGINSPYSRCNVQMERVLTSDP